MEEVLATEYIQSVELIPEQWEYLQDLLCSLMTVNVVGFVVLCIVAGLILGRTLWRWMK